MNKAQLANLFAGPVLTEKGEAQKLVYELEAQRIYNPTMRESIKNHLLKLKKEHGIELVVI